MRRPQRLIALTVLAAFSIALAGCSSGNFDPTDMMDWFDTKKKLPGDRKPVFPEGVPGVEQGVPKDLYRGGQQQPDQPPVVEAPAPEPRAKSRKSSSNSAPRSVAPAAAPAEQDAAPASDEGVAAAPPAPPPAKRKQTSITAPPPDPQPQARQPQQAAPPPPQQAAPSAFPAPLPSGGFAR